jgi:hypothetical protein
VSPVKVLQIAQSASLEVSCIQTMNASLARPFAWPALLTVNVINAFMDFFLVMDFVLSVKTTVRTVMEKNVFSAKAGSFLMMENVDSVRITVKVVVEINAFFVALDTI